MALVLKLTVMLNFSTSAIQASTGSSCVRATLGYVLPSLTLEQGFNELFGQIIRRPTNPELYSKVNGRKEYLG